MTAVLISMRIAASASWRRTFWVWLRVNFDRSASWPRNGTGRPFSALVTSGGRATMRIFPRLRFGLREMCNFKTCATGFNILYLMTEVALSNSARDGLDRYNCGATR